MCGFDKEKSPRQLMKKGITLIFVGHINFILGAIVHGKVLRHVSKPADSVTTEYCAANIISVISGLLSITTGIAAILVSRNLTSAKLHWCLLSFSGLNSVLSAMCSVGLIVAISLTISNGGKNLVWGCNTTMIPAETRAAILNNECPFDTTRIYDTTLALWFPSMIMAAVEAIVSVRCLVVSLILRGIGPCGQSYLRERLEEEAAAKEGLEKGHVPETHQLIGKGREVQA